MELAGGCPKQSSSRPIASSGGKRACPHPVDIGSKGVDAESGSPDVSGDRREWSPTARQKRSHLKKEESWRDRSTPGTARSSPYRLGHSSGRQAVYLVSTGTGTGVVTASSSPDILLTLLLIMTLPSCEATVQTSRQKSQGEANQRISPRNLVFLGGDNAFHRSLSATIE